MVLAAGWLVGCGGKGAGPSPASTAGPEERFPEAPAAPCMNIPVVGTDVEFEHVTPDETVAIDGVPKVGPQVCTTMACPEDCCNDCSAAYVITVRGNERMATAIELAKLPGCGGTECGIDCKPFGSQPKREYRFVGELVEATTRGGARYRFDVTAFCLLPAGEP